MCSDDPNCMATGFGSIGSDLVTTLMVLVPLIIVITSLHKLSEARESSGAFLIEMLIRAGGAFLIILLIRTVFNI